MSKLAIFGGKPIREKCFPSQNTMDENEINAVIEVMKQGRLSGYRANWGDEFYGGPAIQKLEKEWCKRFGVKHVIPVNSCTSGLQIACGAIGLDSKSECIVSPYSMTCSATAPMIWGATPVFADIEKDFYCLDPKSVEEKITSKTKAIIAVSIFGQPYSLEINKIAKRYKLKVIEDAAQAIGSYYLPYPNMIVNNSVSIGGGNGSLDRWYDAKPRYAGTLGDIGIFSFNYGKHITCGESGMIVTDNDELALRCRLIMNHSEAILNDMQLSDNKQYEILKDMRHIPGFNMRATELNACIVSEQLKKFDDLLHQRRNNVQVLCSLLPDIPSITFSPTRPNCTHSYYCCVFEFDSDKADGLRRDTFINAVKAELPPRIHRESEDVQIGTGYIKPLYLFPIFQSGEISYSGAITNWQKGSCPVAEDMWENKLFLTLYHAPMSSTSDMMDICNAFEKVWENRSELK